MIKKSVILIALFAGAFTNAQVKSRLAQQNAKNLAQNINAGGSVSAGEWGDCNFTDISLPTIQLPECPCVFHELPGLGAGINEGVR